MCNKNNSFIFFIFIFLFLFSSCNTNDEKTKRNDLENRLIGINKFVLQNIKTELISAVADSGKIDDSLQLKFYKVVDFYYSQNDYAPIWSDTGHFRPIAFEMMQYLDTAIMDGLFKSDYHYQSIKEIKNLLEHDSIKKEDPILWSKADLLFTDAFMNVIKDLKQGRIIPDSVSWKNDSSKLNLFFSANLNKFRKDKLISPVLQALQPNIFGYRELKRGIKKFIDSMDTRMYTYVKYPYTKDNKEDSLNFINQLRLRLIESGCLNSDSIHKLDSVNLASVISKFQKKNNLAIDGKISSRFIKYLNLTDKQKLKRILISLDSYKELPDNMPKKYIWVNLPSYNLQVWDNDTVRLNSKIICGKSGTPTPILNSEINEMVTYPTWTVPSSIIYKEMLPGLKRNSSYLSRKGLKLLDSKGERVDPTTIDWSKYSKGIPYRIQQGSGDRNALGVMKFNFLNPFDVYLHDTNQRYFFKNNMRALSHGCVRVEEWKALAFYISKNDSLNVIPNNPSTINTDSISNWLAKKQRRIIPVKNKIPLFIRYITCEGINGTIKIYDDIYDKDKRLIESYFANQ